MKSLDGTKLFLGEFAEPSIHIYDPKTKFCRETHRRSSQKSYLEHVELTISMHPNQSWQNCDSGLENLIYPCCTGYVV
jgi:hypothetical protein